MNSSVENIKNAKKILLQKYLDENIKNHWNLFTRNEDAIFTLDLDGQIIRVNPAFEGLSGYSINEITDFKLHSLFPIESIDKVYNYFHKTVLGQVQNYDCKMCNKLGKMIDINITNIPVNVENQVVGVYSVAKDISQLRKNREETQKLQDIHSALTDHILDIIICTNIQGTILYVSPSCEQTLGYTTNEMFNQTLLSFVHPDDKERAFSARQDVIVNLIKGTISYRLRKKDGKYLWVEALCKAIIDPDTRNILEIVSVIRDITERKKAEEELWKRKRAFRELVEHSPDAVIITKNEEILFINETGASLLGDSKPEDFISKSILEFIHSDYHSQAYHLLDKVINGETTEFNKYKLIQMDGTTFDAEIKGIPTFFQNQQAQHVIVRDIRERKKTEELILNAEKLTIAGQLAAGIAHEVRNPLTAIKGFLQLMESQVNNISYFDIILAEMERIELILSELLVLAKPQELKIESENMQTLIRDVKTLIDTQAIMNNVLIEVINQCSDMTVRCDKNQIKQVLINFLKNAIEAMPNGGNILIEIKKHSNGKAKIIIKDNGSGIPQHILKRVGQPFFTTKEGGTGLGVMISKQIIENHKGTVHIWSDDKGTIIEIILPI